MRLTTERDGTLTLTGKGTRLRAATLSPRIRTGELRGAAFRQKGEREATVVGRTGRARIDIATVSGIELVREVFHAADEGLVALRLTVTNRSGEAFDLDELVPFSVLDGQAVVAGAGPADWCVLRMSRQKNDVPGCVRPAVHDLDFADAAFRSGEVVAGEGVSPGDAVKGGVTSSMLLGDPCLCIANGRDAAAPGLFIGVVGQTEHLTAIRLTPSDDGRCPAALDVVCEYDGALVGAGETRTTHWIVLHAVTDPRRALRDHAEMIADLYHVAPPGPPPSIHCNWSFYGRDMTQAEMEEDLRALAEHPVPFDAYLLDNGWMDTFGTWQANDRFPEGMVHAAECIRDAGYIPGLWTCPFVLQEDSPIIGAYPDLVARDRNGNPCEFKCVDGPAVVLDPTAPSVEAYFAEMFQRFRAWGYDYHKFDFLRAVPNAANVRFHDASATKAQAYRRGMELIRGGLGDDAYLIACGGLFEGSAGIADAVRSGSDSVGRWARPGYRDDRSHVEICIKQNVMRNVHNRLWHTDPDAVMLRRREEPYRGKERYAHLSTCDFTDEEAFTLVVNQYLGGGLICIAERFVELPEDRRALMRHMIPQAAPPAEPLDLCAPGMPSLLLTAVDPPCKALGNWWTLAVGNWSGETVERTVTLPDVTPRMAVFEFRTQKFLGLHNAGDALTLTVPAHGTRVLRLAPWTGSAPILLGTDLHLSGGAMLRDVVIEADSMRGHIETDWDHPVTITAGVPDGDACRVLSAVAEHDGQFAINA